MIKNFLEFQRKICHPEELKETIKSLPRPLVFTNGVFDIIHRGHISYLATARSLGASLLVAINTDKSVQTLEKDSDRPINQLEERTEVIAALEFVECVTWFNEKDPSSLIKLCKPEVLVKGGDWSTQKIIGAKDVLSWGGTVHSIPFKYDTSTTKIIQKIRNQSPAD